MYCIALVAAKCIKSGTVAQKYFPKHLINDDNNEILSEKKIKQALADFRIEVGILQNIR